MSSIGISCRNLDKKATGVALLIDRLCYNLPIVAPDNKFYYFHNDRNNFFKYPKTMDHIFS